MCIDVELEDETIWLTQQQMAELFQSSRTNIVEHIGNIYAEGELDQNSTCREFRLVRKEGNREVKRNITYYNLDMIINLDAILSSTGEKLLESAGNISHQLAMDKAQEEYRKFQSKTLTEVEKSYLETIKKIEKNALDNK